MLLARALFDPFACAFVVVMSQLSPFEIGQIKAHMYHGLCGAEIDFDIYPWGPLVNTLDKKL